MKSRVHTEDYSRALTKEEAESAGLLVLRKMESEGISGDDWELFGGLAGPTKNGGMEYGIVFREEITGQSFGVKITGNILHAAAEASIHPFCVHGNRLVAHPTIASALADPLGKPVHD